MQEDDSQGVGQSYKRLRLWELKTKRLHVEKVQNVRKNWRMYEFCVSVIYTVSKYVCSATAPLQKMYCLYGWQDPLSKLHTSSTM